MQNKQFQEREKVNALEKSKKVIYKKFNILIHVFFWNKIS